MHFQKAISFVFQRIKTIVQRMVLQSNGRTRIFPRFVVRCQTAGLGTAHTLIRSANAGQDLRVIREAIKTRLKQIYRRN